MAVAVYPRLGQLLRERNLTVAELGRQIEARFGLAVDRKTLYRLASPDPVHRADLEIAGAAAAILGVDLGAVFDVQATPADGNAGASSAELTPEEQARLAELLDRQDRRQLTRAEGTELKRLIAANGRWMREYYLQDIARQRGISVAQAQAQVETEFKRAIEEWRELNADSGWRSRIATSRTTDDEADVARANGTV